MFKLSLKKKIAGAALVAVGVVGATAGYAYWSSTGSGAGSATADGQITVTLTGTAVSGLAPGATKAIKGTVAVAGAPDAKLGAVTPSIQLQDADHPDGTVWQSGCSAADFTLAAGASLGVVANGATNKDFGSITMLDRQDVTGPPAVSGNQDGCKGQVIALSFSS